MEQGELIEEAAERAGLDPASLDHRHITSIKRSLTLLFTEIEKKLTAAEYRLLETDIATTDDNQKAIVLPANTIDVADVMIVMDSGDVLPCRRMTRQDYMNLNRNTPAGMPSGWWVSKSLPGEVARLPTGASATDNMILVLWPGANASVSAVRVSYIRETTTGSTLGDDVDARREWWELIARGLAAKIAEKFNPPRKAELVADYMAYIDEMNFDMHPVTISWRGHGFARGRRH